MPTSEVVRSVSPRGEMVLLRRTNGDGRTDTLELRVNGVFAMDSAHTAAESELARLALESLPADRPPRVLIGGLGLGYTLCEVLRHTELTEVVVAEIEPELVRWHRAGLIPETKRCLDDALVEVCVADVADVVRSRPLRSVDVLLLDVDNGPGHLVYDENAELYRLSFLQACRRVLADVGVLAVWSADPAPQLYADLSEVFERVQAVDVPVMLGHRHSAYTVLLGLTGQSAHRRAGT